MKPLLEYLIGTLKLDPNVLRDSTLQRLELIHMEGYLHVGAVMWTTCFRELRALTNGKIARLNPIELNMLHGELWRVGTMLQGPGPLHILQDDHRSWVRPERVAEDAWYENFDADIAGKKVR